MRLGSSGAAAATDHKGRGAIGNVDRVEVVVAGLVRRIGHEVRGEGTDGVAAVLGHDAAPSSRNPSEGACRTARRRCGSTPGDRRWPPRG